MGMFDFLKRETPPTPAESPDEGPSIIHYELAHYAIRQTALADPLLFLAIMASPESRRFIDEIFNSVCELFQQVPAFTSAEIKVYPGRVKGFPCAIIEMPTPTKSPEAYFTGLVALVDLDAGIPEERKNVAARYFTLEKGVLPDGNPRTVLGEWHESMHGNFGTGPAPTVEAFARAIENHL
jgi:hypothetical protein